MTTGDEGSTLDYFYTVGHLIIRFVESEATELQDLTI